eukprot:358850-Chlamydomonas_euryale.AAC.1
MCSFIPPDTPTGPSAVSPPPARRQLPLCGHDLQPLLYALQHFGKHSWRPVCMPLVQLCERCAAAASAASAAAAAAFGSGCVSRAPGELVEDHFAASRQLWGQGSRKKPSSEGVAGADRAVAGRHPQRQEAGRAAKRKKISGVKVGE